MTQQPNPEEIRTKINKQLESGDFTGWFETLYAGAQQNTDVIPWANATTHPLFTGWLEKNDLQGDGKTAIVAGCGLGDDAEKLAKLGFQVTAFDISQSAITWAKQRFPNTTVDYQVADLFNLPAEWLGQFDFILEIFTVQALPPKMQNDALKAIPPLLKDDGQLLLMCVGREHKVIPPGIPWEISRQELKIIETQGLTIESEEDVMWREVSQCFRILYRK
jgi:SAM-dependent methyltransferase